MSKKTSPSEGRGSPREPPALLRRAQLVAVLAALASRELEARLLVEARQHLGVDALDRQVLGAAERGEGLDPGPGEQLALAGGDVRDQAEVVVGLALLVADGAPAADLAMRDRLGVGASLAVRERREERGSDPAEVGGELGEAEGALLPVAEDDVDPLGLDALHRRQQLAVEAELQDEVGLGAAGELGVGDLVAEVAQLRRAVDAEEEVGVAAQSVAEEGRLVDDLGAAAHRLLGASDGIEQGGTRAVAVGDLGDLPSLGLQRLQVAPLELVALAGEQLRVGPALGLCLQLAARMSQVERRQVRAGEEVVEVARREDQLFVEQLHRL